MECSNSYLTQKLAELRNCEVSISIDSAVINHVSTLDVILIAHSYSGCETVLYKEIVMSRCGIEDYQREIGRIISELEKHRIKVNAIVSDGAASQRSAFDETRNGSLQNLPGAKPFERNVRWIYCRAHLVNLVVSDWLRDSRSAARCHMIIGQLSVKLRKKEGRLALGAICPEQIATRFCYDYRIIRFLLRHLWRRYSSTVSHLSI